MNEEASTEHSVSRRVIVIAWLLIAAFATAVYWPGLSGPFLFDDTPNIIEQTTVHADSIDWSALKQAAGAYSGNFIPGRPLATITFAIDHARASGLDARAFKQTNLFIHVLNALLVLTLVYQLLGFSQSSPGQLASALDSARSRQLLFWASAITILWAIHPLQVSTVLYVVQRMEMLAVTFTLLALITYGSGRQRQIVGKPAGWLLLAISVVIAGIGLLAKETGVLFIVFALCLELTLFRFQAQKPATGTVLKSIYGLAIVSGLLLFAFIIIPTYIPPEAYQHRDFTWQERILTQFRVLPLYLSQILLPIPDRMTFHYDAYPVSSSLIDPVTTLLGALLIAGLLGQALWLRHRAPLVALGILWFFSAHLLTSNIFSLELVFEHRNYFAILPVIMVLACLVAYLPKSRISPRLITVFAAILFIVVTLIRSATWGDPLNLAMHHAHINPESERAQLDIGITYGVMAGSNPDSPFYQFALEALDRAGELPNSSPVPEHGMILLARTAGTDPSEEWWNRLIDKLENRPLSAQSQRAVRSLVLARIDSLPIEDQWLTTTYRTLSNRPEAPASLLMPFASYALKIEEAQIDPQEVLREVARRGAEEPENLQKWADQLVQSGYHEQAMILMRPLEDSPAY